MKIRYRHTDRMGHVEFTWKLSVVSYVLMCGAKRLQKYVNMP